MNRHLDRCYLEKKGAIVQGGLLWDFLMFFIEACLLFAVGWSLRSGIEVFEYLGALLRSGSTWYGDCVAHQIHFRGRKSYVVRWSLVNLVAILIAILIIAFPLQSKIWVLMALTVARSIADYWFCWDFYFPPS